MKHNRTVLEKIGIFGEIVKQWKLKGLLITYPMKKNKKYFISKDGKVFVESADKYVPPLTEKETTLYTKYPEKFRETYLKNVKFYFTFHTFLYDKLKDLNNLIRSKEKLSASLSLMYLFLSGMDHHHYHYDRYLVYEDYPQTPVGYWWKKLKDFYFKAFKEKITNNSIPPAKFLLTASRDEKTLKEFKNRLSNKDCREFGKILRAIKIFEDTQQKEGEIISGFPAKENLLLRSGFGLWNKTCELIKDNPRLIDNKYRKKILSLIEGHPITSTRELLLIPQLKSFQKEIFIEFEKEIKRWIIN